MINARVLTCAMTLFGCGARTELDVSYLDAAVADVSHVLDVGVDAPDGGVCVVTNSGFTGQIWGSVSEGVSYGYTATGCVLFDATNNRYSTADGQRYDDPSCTGPPLGIVYPDGGKDFMCDNTAGHSLVADIDDVPARPCTSDTDCTTAGTHCADAQHQPLSGVCPDMMQSECPNVCVFTQCIELGMSGTFVAPASGNLHLYFNDNVYADNAGTWNVCISTIQR